MLEIVHRAVRSLKNEMGWLKRVDAKSFIKIRGREVFVRAYVPMFEQLVVNVIKNGLEAIEEAGRERGVISINVGTTELMGSKYSRWVGVEIEDNGIGIPEENMDKLTALFTTRGDRKASSGIGLFIGKKIVDIHKGRIHFESKAGVGTKVTLLLPEFSALQKAEMLEGESVTDGDSESPSTEATADS